MTKTITLTGAEAAVIDLGGQNVAIKNLGEGSIYASAFPNVIAGEDNVIEIPAGSGEVLLDARGKAYLLGTGKVQLTGTDYATPNFKLPSSSEGGGGATGDVTKGYVDAQDTTNLGTAKAYTDSKVGAVAEAANEAKTAADTAAKAADAANAAATAAQTVAANAETTAAAAQSTAETNKGNISALQIAVATAQGDIAGNTAAIAGNKSEINALRTEVDAAAKKAETALSAVEDLSDKSVVSSDGAFDLRYTDSKLQANINGEWTDITTGTGESGGVSQSYVDTHDAATLTDAKEYTDSKIQPLQTAVNETVEDIQSLADRVSDTENAIDVLNGTGEGSVSRAVSEGIAEIIADAPEGLNTLKEIADWIEDHPDDASAMNSEIQQNKQDIADINDKSTGILAQAKEYTNTQCVDTLNSANDYTDSKTAEAQEAAQTYADEKSDSALEAAKEYTDSVAAEKADKPINAFVLIETVNWQSDDNKYPYYYNIPIEGARSADRAEVWFAADSEEAAQKCEFSTEVTTSDGYVTIRAKHIPETVLSANVQIGVLSATNTLHVGTNGSTSVSGGSIEEHNADHEAHPDIRAYINELKGRIIALEVAAGGEINANPFAVTFGDLDGVIADGVWMPASARLEF